MKFKKKIWCLFLAVLIGGCTSSLKQIKDSTVPFERPSYSILPPKGEGWSYIDREQIDAFDLAFFKKFKSRTHSVAGIIAEMPSFALFDSPEDFLNFVEKSKALNRDPRRFKMLKNEMVLDEKFGQNSVKFHYLYEDNASYNIGENKYLVVKAYGYSFIHPQFSNIVINISYSERGTENELESNFEEEAKKFVNGLVLKNGK